MEKTLEKNDICEETIVGKEELIRHVERFFHCNKCDRQFTHKGNLNSHILMKHSNRKDFTCETCSKDFSTNYQLKRHVNNIHAVNNENIFQCSICDKVFSKKMLLKKHETTFHRVPTKKCDFCGKCFKETSKLNVHIKRVHEKSYKAKCHICNKDIDKRHLKEHVDRHENKSYNCTICGRKFSTKADMTKHDEIVHKNIYNYKCEKCNKRFSSKTNLESHICTCQSCKRKM